MIDEEIELKYHTPSICWMKAYQIVDEKELTGMMDGALYSPLELDLAELNE